MGRFKSHNRLLAALVLACRNATWNQKKKKTMTVFVPFP